MIKKVISILLFILIILIFFKEYFWTNFIINVLIVAIGLSTNKEGVFYKQVPLFLLFIPILIGIVGFLRYPLRDVIRDIYYFLIPIISLLIGYILHINFTSTEIVKKFVYLGFIFSLLHIGISIFKFNFDLINNFSSIRMQVSPGNSLTVLSSIILLYDKKYQLKLNFDTFLKVSILCINVFAFVLFGSRTYLIIVLIFLFFILLNKFGRKLLIITACLSTIPLFIFLSSGSIEERKDDEAYTFSSKLKTTFIELGTNEFLNERDIVTKYRAYESLMATKTYEIGSPLEQIWGNGFGKMIDLEVDVPLVGEDNPFRLIPILHNGYLYILVKTGAIGFLFYLFFYIKVFKKIKLKLPNKRVNKNDLFYEKLVKSSIIALLVSNFVVSSIFNFEFEFLGILIFSLYFKLIEKKSVEITQTSYAV